MKKASCCQCSLMATRSLLAKVSSCADGSRCSIHLLYPHPSEKNLIRVLFLFFFSHSQNLNWTNKNKQLWATDRLDFHDSTYLRDQYYKTDFAITQLPENYGQILMHHLSLNLQLCTHYQFEVILMLSTKHMQICTGLNSLSPYNNESKSSHNLCYCIYSFIVLIPSRRQKILS